MGYIKLVVGNIQENAYIYYDEKTGNAAVIDPGDEALKIKNSLNNKGLTVTFVLLTHGHYDHTGAVNDFSAPVYAHFDEEALLLDPNKSYAVSGPLQPAHFLTDGEEIKVGERVLKVIHTPGHTAGSCCYYDEEEKLLFSGDTLFRGSVGRYDLFSGDKKALENSIRNKLYTLPDDVRVLPGHMGESTIGYEKANNAFIRVLGR